MNDFAANKGKFEAEFWGDCSNTLREEIKQLVYAERMGLQLSPTWQTDISFDLNGKGVIDIGGGPVSLLLKCRNRVWMCAVVDPLRFPDWIEQRYASVGIARVYLRGEDLTSIPTGPYDEAWIYNVLQHVDDPGLVIANARKNARVIRMFEWIDMEPYPGHPHKLTQSFLEERLRGKGRTEQLNDRGCVGRAFFGVFPT